MKNLLDTGRDSAYEDTRQAKYLFEGNPTKRDAKKALQIAQNITEQIETHVE